MPNVILPNLGIELPDVGSDQDTWGDILNADLEILDLAVQYDVISKTLSNVDVTLTAVEAASAVINLTGTLLANVNVIVPATPVRVYLVRNQTSGAFTVTVKTAAGTGTPVQQGTSSLVYSDGTNIIQGATSVNGSFSAGNTSVANLSYTGTLTGGTGVVNIGSGQIYKDAVGNVGVGTTVPDLFARGFTRSFGISSAGTSAMAIDGVTGSFAEFGFNGTRYGSIFSASANEFSVSAIGASTNFRVLTNENIRFTIDPAGNGGFGVTPSAQSVSGTVVKGFEVARIGSGFVVNVGNGNTNVTANAYFGSGGWTYANSGFAAYAGVLASNGNFIWNTAPSGTAGNPITFTQALTLFQAGQLLLGATSLSAGAFAEFTSTTGALIVPRMTTAQRDAIGAVANGAIIYNTTTNKMNFRENGAWVQPTVTAA